MVKTEIQIDITYQKAWHARIKVMKIIYDWIGRIICRPKTINECLQLRRVHCSHVLAVYSQNYVNIHTASLMDRHFQSSAYRKVCTLVFHLILDKRYWPERVSPYMLLPTKRCKDGRLKSTRIRNEMDENSGRRVRCGICKEIGQLGQLV